MPAKRVSRERNYLYRCLRDYNGALAELELARRTLPNDPRVVELTGYILRRRGQQEEGVRNLERSIELDPRNPFYPPTACPQLSGSAALSRTGCRIRSRLNYCSKRCRHESSAVLWLTLTGKPRRDRCTKRLIRFWPADPGAISDAADAWFQCALAERDPAAAERAPGGARRQSVLGRRPCLFSRSFGEGLLARMMKDEARAHAAFTKARLEQEKIVQARPEYGPPLCVLGSDRRRSGAKRRGVARRAARDRTSSR